MRPYEEQLAGSQAALADDVAGGLVEHARLRGHDYPAVLGLHPAAGAQAVAVQRGADHAAVREGDGGRAVPRLHQAGVEGVEALQVRGEVVAVLPRLGHHHHHRVRQRPAGEHQQLEHVVEGGAVAARGADDRGDLLEILGREELRRELRLARAHPVDVAAQRVDLAVVGDVAVRVRELPAREGVGGEPRVDERQRRLDPRVLQVGEVAEQLRRREHALVDDRPARGARDHEVRPGGQLRHAADHVEPALEGLLVGRELVARAHDQLLDVRREVVGGDADVVLVHRDVAPAEDGLALLGHRRLEQLLELGAARLLTRPDAHEDPVLAGRRQLGALRAQELVGHLEQDPGAVARVRVSTGGSAVIEVLQRDDRPLDGLVGGLTVQARYEGDSAGVVFEVGVIKPNRFGRPGPELHYGAPDRAWGRLSPLDGERSR
jgi:hypothetical protein